MKVLSLIEHQRSFAACSCLFYLSLVVLLAGCNEETPVENRPNVILILADDLGYETMTVNGGESYSTPNIDELSSDGMRFKHCYAQPQCTPSRLQLLTGIYNQRNYVKFGLVDTTQVTVTQLFRHAGYETGVVGKWQLGKNPNNPNQLGFDEYLLWQLTKGRVDSIGWDPAEFPGKGYQQGGRDTRYSQPVLDDNGNVKIYGSNDYGPEVINDYALNFIDRKSQHDKPFFLFYSMILTHCPFSPTPDSPEWMNDDTTVMTYKGQSHYFNDMVIYMDKMVGNIGAKLDELDISKNTLVIFVGDNGTDTPIVSRFQGRDVAGGKFLSTDAGTRVPLIVKWPGVIKPGTLNADLIDFTDFMPTMLDLAGIQVPDSLDIDGVSFKDQLTGNVGEPRDWIYSWFMNPFKKQPVVFARNHQFKLYSTGEFYEIPMDYLEENPITYDSLNEQSKEVYNRLQKVLDMQSMRRLNAIK